VYIARKRSAARLVWRYEIHADKASPPDLKAHPVRVICALAPDILVSGAKETVVTGDDFSVCFPTDLPMVEKLVASGEVDVIVTDFRFASGSFADWLSLWPLPCVLIVYGDENPQRIERALHDESSFFLQHDEAGFWLRLLPVLIRKACAVREAVSRQNTHLAMTEHLYLNLIRAIPDIVYILDGNGCFTYLNEAIKNLGWNPVQLIGKHFSVILHPDEVARVGRSAVIADYARRKPEGPWETPKLFDERRSGGRMTQNLELRLRTGGFEAKIPGTPEGWRFGTINAYGEINAVGFVMPEFKNAPLGTIGVIRDVSVRWEHERALEEHVKSREILFHEIHHRVKNNLQIVSSLLNLQQHLIVDDRSRTVFLECQTQIQSMAMVHDQIYHESELDTVSMKEYFDNLCSYLGGVYDTESHGIRIAIESKAEIKLNLDSAIPVALIVNELVSNSFKHAFPLDRGGTVRVILDREQEGEASIAVRDDGIGLAAARKTSPSDKPQGLGLDLVAALVQQVSGRIEQFDDGGSVSVLRFMLPRKQ